MPVTNMQEYSEFYLASFIFYFSRSYEQWFHVDSNSIVQVASYLKIYALPVFLLSYQDIVWKPKNLLGTYK